MRTNGSYTLHQSLTLESASIVKQALSFARRRGHSQVTPLHVASAMLSSSSPSSSTAGLFRQACLQSHSHPLQCKALELCFNVALNRLPASACSSPIFSPQSNNNPHIPSLSNALVAAFKRAQAHQRRGSVENNQHVLSLKVEVGQLVLSILDDPSVSRVMREAGFSSMQVKANVEKALYLENNNNTSNTQITQSRALTTVKPAQTASNKGLSVMSKEENLVLPQSDDDGEDDVLGILESMMKEKTKNTIVLTECVANGERLLKELIQKFDKKNVPDEMKLVQFISVPLSTLRNISKEEFEVKLGELRALVKSYVNTGVVLYLSDLGWVSSFWSKYGDNKNNDDNYFCPVEYMIMELSRLIHGENNRKLWIMGITSFKSYEKCRIGKPCLESLWCLHPLTIPVGGNLSLSLSLSSSMHGKLKQESEDDHCYMLYQRIKNQLTCCSDCSLNFKREIEDLIMNAKNGFNTTRSSLPPWLQQECVEIQELCKKWNLICTSVHKKTHFLEKAFCSSALSPSSSTSVSSSHDHKFRLGLSNFPMILEPYFENQKHKFFEQENPKPELLSNPNSSPNSASSSEATDHLIELSDKFNQFNSENLNTLCNALLSKVPRHAELVPDIVDTVLRCRSGLIRSEREDSWLFFLGPDSESKEALARELAKKIFSNYDDNFISVGLTSSSSSSSLTSGENSTEEVSKIGNNKRSVRYEHGQSPYDRFTEAMHHNPSRVFFVKDFDQFDDLSLKGFERAIEDGSVTCSGGEVVQIKDAIIILNCDKFCRREFTDINSNSSPRRTKIVKEINDREDEKEKETALLLDLNVATEDEHNSVVSAKGILVLGLVDMQVVFEIHVL